MLETLKKSKPFTIAASIPGVDYCTNFTKGIRVTATTASRAMDQAGGGCLKHGGFHRLFGGHDISNLTYWKRYGLRYPKELAKDFITPNGLPYPKLELAVKKGWIKASTAQKFGTWNIGKLGSASIGLIDTAFTARKFTTDRETLCDRWKSTTLKGAVKVGTGLSTGNVPLAVAGAADLSMVAYAKLESSIEFDFEPDFQFAFST